MRGEVGGGEAEIEQMVVVDVTVAVLGETEGGCGVVGWVGGEAGAIGNIFKLAIIDEGRCSGRSLRWLRCAQCRGCRRRGRSYYRWQKYRL